MSFSISVNTTSSFPVVTLNDNTNNSNAIIYAFGGILNAWNISIDEKLINVIDGFSSQEDAIANMSFAFKSAKLSPFVCRMDKGSYTFADEKYSIEKFYLQQHAIHGIVYDGLYEITNMFANEHKAELELLHYYKGNDAGYPFPYSLTVLWRLEANNKLTVTTTIQHRNQLAIPMADGWHPYFNLGTSVDDCTLQFDSNQQVEFDETLIPTGKKIADVRFIGPTSLKNIALDNCFKLNNDAKCILQTLNRMSVRFVNIVSCVTGHTSIGEIRGKKSKNLRWCKNGIYYRKSVGCNA